jgi:hypothetical protein
MANAKLLCDAVTLLRLIALCCFAVAIVGVRSDDRLEATYIDLQTMFPETGSRSLARGTVRTTSNSIDSVASRKGD